MTVKIEGLRKGYLVMKSPVNGTWLLAYEPPKGNKLDELEYFDHLPSLNECDKIIDEWILSVQKATK